MLTRWEIWSLPFLAAVVRTGLQRTLGDQRPIGVTKLQRLVVGRGVKGEWI